MSVGSISDRLGVGWAELKRASWADVLALAPADAWDVLDADGRAVGRGALLEPF